MKKASRRPRGPEESATEWCHHQCRAQYWQQVGVSASARTVREKTFGQRPGVKKGSKEATSLQEKHQGQTEILQEVQGLDSRRRKVFFSDDAPF